MVLRNDGASTSAGVPAKTVQIFLDGSMLLEQSYADNSVDLTDNKIWIGQSASRPLGHWQRQLSIHRTD